MAVRGLSALTQLTRLATDFPGFVRSSPVCKQLEQLTGLRELDVPYLMHGNSRGSQMLS